MRFGKVNPRFIGCISVNWQLIGIFDENCSFNEKCCLGGNGYMCTRRKPAKICLLKVFDSLLMTLQVLVIEQQIR